MPVAVNNPAKLRVAIMYVVCSLQEAYVHGTPY